MRQVNQKITQDSVFSQKAVALLKGCVLGFFTENWNTYFQTKANKEH